MCIVHTYQLAVPRNWLIHQTG